MSSSIWMQCAGGSDLSVIGALRLSPWRAVEAQHQVSTRKLVDTREEQELLEELIDRAKPTDPSSGNRHYLLATPFRYPPLRHGSRFGSRHRRGIWYGSETRATAFAEVAYYRMVFLEGTRAHLGALVAQLTLFRVNARTLRGVDLVAPPFDAHRAVIASPVSYAETQALGDSMRDAGVEMIRYPSARDPNGGANVAAFSASVFGRSQPRDGEKWHCVATRERVELFELDVSGGETYGFERPAFLVGGSLPVPAL